MWNKTHSKAALNPDGQSHGQYLRLENQVTELTTEQRRRDAAELFGGIGQYVLRSCHVLAHLLFVFFFSALMSGAALALLNCVVEQGSTGEFGMVTTGGAIILITVGVNWISFIIRNCACSSRRQ